MVRSSIIFVAQVVVLGLAFAFVIVVANPELLSGVRVVSIKESDAARAGPTVSEGPFSYAKAVRVAAPAVVNIHTTQALPDTSADPFIERLMPNFESMPRALQNQGSGVLISPAGYILTSHHVVDRSETIQIMLKDGRTTFADLVGADPETDIAVLKIELQDLPSITINNSEGLNVGDVVLAIGNPFGVGQTVTMGIVSATGRNRLGINTFEDFIQTDAAINPGNSGGALVNARGELVGINSAIFSQSGGSEGIGFAIPIALARGIMRQLVEKGYVERGWLGIEVMSLQPALAEQLGIEPNSGVLISAVSHPGPGLVVGLRPGDVITHINAKPVTDTHHVVVSISSLGPGEQVSLQIVRQSETLIVHPTVTQRPSAFSSP